MTTLRVIIDEMLASAPGSVGRYTEELTRELIATAPRGCYVEAVVAASTEAEYAAIGRALVARAEGFARRDRDDPVRSHQGVLG